ncbi:MAG: low temperature requirement protein A [Chloroflexota bacterium]|jgi:low temperature requirement protein LtrA
MASLRSTFRQWWRPPRRASDRELQRSVTFLELFYDLVYVVLIAQLAHTLAEHVTLSGALGYGFLFIIVWWAWFNGSSYHDIHGNNDIRTRIFTFLQMFTVAAMAIFAGDALGESSVGFALSYAAFQLILTYLWWRTGVYDPNHRPLSRPYSFVFLVTTLLFVVSILVPIPVRFYLWGVAVLLSLILPFNTFRQGRNNRGAQEEINRIINVSPSLVERFGLLTIIVLGEVVVGTVNGVAERPELNWSVGITAALGMIIAIGLWWIYFDFVSHRKPIATTGKVSQWFYLHLPLTAGIAAVGAAVFNVVEHSGEPLAAGVRWLLVGSVSLILVCVAWLMQSIQLPDEQYELYRRGGLITFVSALAILLLGVLNLPPIPLLILLVLLMITPVFYGIKVWIQVFGAQEIPLE